MPEFSALSNKSYQPLFAQDLSNKNQAKALDLQNKINAKTDVLNNMQALRELVEDTSLLPYIDYNKKTGYFDCKIGDQIVSSLDKTSVCQQLNRQNLSVFSHPLLAFCQIKDKDDLHSEALNCVLTKDKTELTLKSGDDVWLTLPLQEIKQQDWEVATRIFNGLPSNKPSGFKSVPVHPELLVAQPPSSPIKDIDFANLVPELLSTENLPDTERFGVNFFGKAKDLIWGANKQPQFRSIDSNIHQLNSQLAELPNLFNQLQSCSATLEASVNDMNMSIQKTTQGLVDAQQYLTNLENECGVEGVSEHFAVKELQGKILHIKVQLDTLEKQLDLLKKTEAEGGERCRWRHQISATGLQIDELHLKKIITEDKLWLAQLQNILGDKKALTSEELTYALSKLMQNGIALPKLDITLAILEAFYPIQDQSKPNGASLPKVESFNQTPEIEKQYQKLQQDCEDILQKREDQLLFLRILDAACKTADQTLANELKILQTDHQSAKRRCDIQITNLERFFRMFWRDPSKSASEHADKVRIGLQASIDISAVANWELIDENQGIDGELTLFLGNYEQTVIKHNRLKFKQKEFDEANLEVNVNKITQMAYQNLDKTTQAHLQLLAQDCLQLRFQLGSKQDIQSNFNFSHAIDKGELLSKANEHKDEFMLYLCRRETLLQTYRSKLEELHTISQGLSGDMLVVATKLDKAIADIQTEQEMIASVIEATDAMADVDKLNKAKDLQKSESITIKELLDKGIKPFASKLARINLEAYQLRSRALKENIRDTETIARGRNELQQELEKTTELIFGDLNRGNSGELQNLLKTHPKHHLVIQYHKQHAEIEAMNREIAVLNAQFKIDLLALQAEEKRVHGPDGAGYPTDVNWSDWLVAKMGENATYYYGNEKVKPSDLLLLQQLALSGKNINEAKQEMAQSLIKLASDPQQALKELGFTPGQLATWYSAYPEQIQQLSTNLSHAYNSLQKSGENAVAEAVKTAWDRGSMESVLEDALFGRRDALVGVVESQPMPPALIALLKSAEWAPYFAGGIKGLLKQNLGGQAAGVIIGTLVPGGGIGVAVATAVLGGCLGMAQAHVEKEIADKVAEHRNINVAVNGVLKAMSLGPEADITTRLKEMASYTMRREALRHVGTIGRDVARDGKLGAVKQAGKELALTWKHASFSQKAILVGITAAVSLLAIPLIAIGPYGWIIAGIFSLFIITVGPLFGWPTINEWFMQNLATEVRKELNNEILDKAMEKAQINLKRAIDTQKVSIRKGIKLTEKDLQNNASSTLQTQLEIMLTELKNDPKFKNCSTKKISIEFDERLKAIKSTKPELFIENHSEVLAGIDKGKIDEIKNRVNKKLEEAISFS